MGFSERDIRKEIGNLAVAVFLNCQFIRTILTEMVPGFTAHGIRFVVILSAVLFLFSSRKLSLSPRYLLIPLAVLLYFVATSIIFPGKSAASPFEVFSYALLPFLLVMIDIDIRKVVKWTLLITAPAILVAENIFVHYSNDAIKMLISYSVLFPVSCALTYLICYQKYDRKHLRILNIALCLIQFYYFYELVSHGSRGAVLSLLVLLVLLLYFKPRKGGDAITRRLGVFFISAAVAVVLVLVFTDEVLALFNAILGKLNIQIWSLRKSILLLQKSDVSHGRMEMYSLALQGFRKSPLFGHGLDMFMENTGMIYPHNFVLQLAYDGGLFLLLAVLAPVIRASVKIFGEKSYRTFAAWALLFSVSVIGALFSGDLWTKYTLWFFFAWCVRMQGARAEQDGVRNDALPLPPDEEPPAGEEPAEPPTEPAEPSEENEFVYSEVKPSA